MAADVLVSESEGVMLLTLNRPEAKNAATLAASRLIAQALDRLDAEDHLRVAIITGAGGTFCSGMDLKKFLEGERPAVPGRGFLAITEKSPKKPLIAAVEGYALAGGCETAMACDLIVAGQSAKFGLPEVKRGLAATAGGMLRLPKQIAPRIALEMILTGDMIDAARAYELGLVNQVVPDGQALAAAQALARRITVNAPLSVVAAKRIVREGADWPTEHMFTLQRAIADPLFASEDAKEGSRAFAEKRAPRWSGR